MVLHLLLVFAMLLGSSEQHQKKLVEEVLECSSPYVVIGGRCVFVDILTTGTWQAMRDYCKDLGGDLVVLHDLNFYGELILHINGNGWGDRHYWAGGTDEGHEGDWVWVDGSPMWMGPPMWGYQCPDHNQEPNDEAAGNCAMLNYVTHLLLDDWNCNYESGHAICEQ